MKSSLSPREIPWAKPKGFPKHRMSLYFIPLSVSLRVARTLLKRLLS